jgi:3-hydroxyisobutyrate dehydrogenase
MPENMQHERNSTVGVLGAGRMGMPIIGRLAQAGHTVRVYDPETSTEPETVRRGAQAAASPLAAVEGSEFVLLCVGYEEQVEALLVGSERLFEQSDPGTVFVVLSTIATGMVQRLAEHAERLGRWLVDAPVSGSGSAAELGQLLSLVGGPTEAVERLGPVLDAYSANVVHLGAAGSGQVAKAVTNLIMLACVVANHEGLALGDRFGLEDEKLREALRLSSAANGALNNWGKQTMVWAEHDFQTVARMATEADISLPQAGVTRELCRALKSRLYQLDQYGI